MRSRYSAYVLQLEDYLLSTWHASTRPATMDFAAAPPPKWMGLDVKAKTEKSDRATVEFIARYRIGGRAQRLHEVSRFVREGDRWYYVDAEDDAADDRSEVPG